MEFLDLEFWSFLWDAERYEALINSLGVWAPVMAVAAMVIVSFLPIPAETIAIANGMVFGRWYGFVLTWLGAMAGAIIAFCLARCLGRGVIDRVLPKKTLERFEKATERRGAPFLLLVRMIPLIPYTVVNYGSGLSPIRPRTYLWTSGIGMSPPIFAFVSIGALMTEQPWLGWMTLSAAAAMLLLLAYYTRKRWLREPSA